MNNNINFLQPEKEKIIKRPNKPKPEDNHEINEEINEETNKEGNK